MVVDAVMCELISRETLNITIVCGVLPREVAQKYENNPRITGIFWLLNRDFEMVNREALTGIRELLTG